MPSETLQKLMSAGVGQTVPEEYIPLLMEETRLGDVDTRSVCWQRDPDKLPIQSFKAIIIGAGFSGLCAAIRLKELGIPFVILERTQTSEGPGWKTTIPVAPLTRRIISIRILSTPTIGGIGTSHDGTRS